MNFLKMNVEQLLNSYPRVRAPLPDAYDQVYLREYLINKEAGTLATRITALLESWMHRQVSQKFFPGNRVLEIGAGTLNHLRYETSNVYDVVEPLDDLYQHNSLCSNVTNFFAQLGDVPRSSRYDRIISIAVLEHLDNLPYELAMSSLLLEKHGLAQHAFPSEGGIMWGLGWRLVTGPPFRIRTGLSYKVLMRFEHVNTAKEIITLMRHFFSRVTIVRFPLPWHPLSFYTYAEGSLPRYDRCRAFLDEKIALR